MNLRTVLQKPDLVGVSPQAFMIVSFRTPGEAGRVHLQPPLPLLYVLPSAAAIIGPRLPNWRGVWVFPLDYAPSSGLKHSAFLLGSFAVDFFFNGAPKTATLPALSSYEPRF